MARTSTGKKTVSVRPNARKTGVKPQQVRRIKRVQSQHSKFRRVITTT